MAFHPDKCNVILVTRNKKPIEFDYTLHEHTLDHVTKAEYLGITFSSDLKWGSHGLRGCAILDVVTYYQR
jgi:hypothetical protein